MRDIIQPRFELAQELLKDHRLVSYAVNDSVSGGRIEAYSLRREGTRIMCVELAFLPGYIAITGDYCPGQNGVISRIGYGRAWFTGELSYDYLAGKFLTQQFVPELAAAILIDWANADHMEDLGLAMPAARRAREALLHWARVCEGLPQGDSVESWEARMGMHEALQPFGYTDDGLPGWWYQPRDVAVLAAIQQRFAELYHAHSAALAEETASP
jgi:hypothetical protein